ncbi:MAG TPA: glycerophosphodiester phosphodiesterase [Gaiellaceae bacterium]
MKRPLVLAHRGACWEAPENTLEAFELAIEEGADYVEFDVRAREGELVICHDPEPPPGLPTLDEVLDSLKGRVGVAVEIKEQEITEAVLAALKRYEIDPDALIVLSFRIRAVETVRRLRPELRTVLHLGRPPDPSAATRFWGAGFRDESARPRVMATAQSLGLAVLVFTVNDPARMRELAALGVDGIFSDRPGLLRETLAALPEPGRGRSRQEKSR